MEDSYQMELPPVLKFIQGEFVRTPCVCYAICRYLIGCSLEFAGLPFNSISKVVSPVRVLRSGNFRKDGYRNHILDRRTFSSYVTPAAKHSTPGTLPSQPSVTENVHKDVLQGDIENR
jgi:hypothetical protein